jgi:phosphatidylglycerol---prolipoprotein diacylglyceryl transferase
VSAPKDEIVQPHLDVFGLHLSTYFLIVSLAIVLGSLWFLRRSKARELSLHSGIDLTLVALIAGFLGARLTHVVWEEPDLYLADPVLILHVWNGGFVFLGGVIFALLATMAFCQWRREPFWFWADLAAPPIALTYSLGRWACLMQGCCYGRVCEWPWAVYLSGVWRHPTQIYASLWELGVVVILLSAEKRLRASGLLFCLWLFLHALGRLVMEIFRADPRGPLLFDLSLGSWMSLVLGAFAAQQLLRATHSSK